MRLLSPHLPHPWLKALVLNSLLFALIAASFVLPGISTVLLVVQYLFLGTPIILLFFMICTIQQVIIPTPPFSSLRWTVLSAAFGVIGLILALFVARFIFMTFFFQPETIAPIWEYVLIYGLSASIFGSSVGYGQWLSVSHRSPLTRWWIGISSLDYTLATLAVFLGVVAI